MLVSSTQRYNASTRPSIVRNLAEYVRRYIVRYTEFFRSSHIAQPKRKLFAWHIHSFCVPFFSVYMHLTSNVNVYQYCAVCCSSSCFSSVRNTGLDRAYFFLCSFAIVLMFFCFLFSSCESFCKAHKHFFLSFITLQRIGIADACVFFIRCLFNYFQTKKRIKSIKNLSNLYHLQDMKKWEIEFRSNSV